MVDLDSIESVSSSLIDQLSTEKDLIALERAEIEKWAPSQIEVALAAARDTSDSIKILSNDLSVSVNSLQGLQGTLSPVLRVLKDLLDQAVYVQNAGNYVRLVAHVGKLVNGMEQSLHHLNQRKPYHLVLQRSLALERQRIAQEKSGNGDGSVRTQNEFDQVTDLMKSRLWMPLLKLLEISTTVRPIQCHHLKKMLAINLKSLASRCETEFRDFYAASLDTLQWPTAMSDAEEGTFNETSLHFFRAALDLLVKLQETLRLLLPSDTQVSADPASSPQASPSASEEPPQAVLPELWCISLLVKPLQIRFNFNFRGRESTNRYDRPEWHFTYIRQLLKNHSKFLEFVTSLLQSMDLGVYDAKHEVLRGLIPLIKEKLIADIAQILASGGSNIAANAGAKANQKGNLAKLGSLVMNNASFLGNSSPGLSSSTPVAQQPIAPLIGAAANILGHNGPNAPKASVSHSSEMAQALLSHTINEILDFEKTLTDVYEYPSGNLIEYPRPIDVLAMPDKHALWLELEVSSMRQHLRSALDAPDAWERQYATIPVSDDPARVPRHCFILFNVLSILQDRYSLLGEGREEQMSEFLEAQLAILNDYLNELKDSQAEALRALDGLEYLRQCCLMYNAAWYARKVLEEWGSQTLYIELLMWNKGITDPDLLTGTVFDPLILQSNALCKHNLRLMADKTLQVFTNAYQKSYVRANFLEDRPESDQELDVSPLLCEVLFLFREAFTKVENSLNCAAFRKFWKLLASGLNAFLFENIILKKHFHAQGASQFRTDVQAIWLLWRTQTPVPESFFKETHEALCILTQSSEQLAELSKILAAFGGKPSPQLSAELAQFGIFKLTPNQARLVVDRHIDKKGLLNYR
jgi:hypothetical protein